MSLSRLTTYAAVRYDTTPTKGDAGSAKAGSDDAVTNTGLIDRLLVLLPTEVVGIYTFLVTGLFAYLNGAQASADTAATLLPIRYALIGITAITVVIWTARNWKFTPKSKGDKRIFPWAEGIGALVALLGWTLSSPGSPIFDLPNKDLATVLPPLIAGVAVLITVGFAQGVRKPVKAAG